MLQQIEKKTSKVPVSGTIERVNEKGIKLNGEWFNFSKFMPRVPELKEGDLIEFKSSKNFINEVSRVTPGNGTSERKDVHAEAPKPENPLPPAAPPLPMDTPDGDSSHGETDRDELLKCLKDAVQITEKVDSAHFSTQDIIKLALTLFIHRTA